jgi:hypothetical protein
MTSKCFEGPDHRSLSGPRSTIIKESARWLADQKTGRRSGGNAAHAEGVTCAGLGAAINAHSVNLRRVSYKNGIYASVRLEIGRIIIRIKHGDHNWESVES